MVTMSRLNHDFQWAIRDKQSLLRGRFLHLINMPGPGIEPPTSGMPSGHANHYTTAPLHMQIGMAWLINLSIEITTRSIPLFENIEIFINCNNVLVHKYSTEEDYHVYGDKPC